MQKQSLSTRILATMFVLMLAMSWVQTALAQEEQDATIEEKIQVLSRQIAELIELTEILSEKVMEPSDAEETTGETTSLVLEDSEDGEKFRGVPDPETTEEELGFLFYIDTQFESDLDKKILSEAMLQRFEESGFSLSTDAIVRVEESGKKWLIEEGERTFLVGKAKNQINIYGFLLLSEEPAQSSQPKVRGQAAPTASETLEHLMASQSKLQTAIEIQQPAGTADEAVKFRGGIRPEQLLEGALSGAVERALIYELGGMRSEFSSGWGHQARIWTGEYKMVWKGLQSYPKKIYRNKRDGLWQKGWVRLENAQDTLDVKLRHFRKTPGYMEVRFQIYATSLFRGDVQARQYKHGQQLWSVSGNGRARAQIYIDMRCWVSGSSFHWNADGVDIKYSDVVMDRVGHAGGYAARVLGDTLTGAVRQWFPDNERRAIENAKQAVYSAIRGDVNIRDAIMRTMN